MKYTFGKSISAQRLEKMLERYPAQRRKISSLLSDITNKMLEVTAAKHSPTVKLCLTLLKDHAIKRLHEKTGLSEKVVSYTENVIRQRHRAYLEGFEWVCVVMKRIEQ